MASFSDFLAGVPRSIAFGHKKFGTSLSPPESPVRPQFREWSYRPPQASSMAFETHPASGRHAYAHPAAFRDQNDRVNLEDRIPSGCRLRRYVPDPQKTPIVSGDEQHCDDD